MIEAKAGTGEPVHRLRKTFPTQALAEQAATSTLKYLTQTIAILNISIMGTPSVLAEGKIALQGFRADVPKDWTIQRVVHTMEGRGFTTQLTAEHQT